MEVKRLTGSGTVLRAHNREYAPEELQAILLRYLCGCAETYLGEKVERAVITVPAYFTDVQRRLTAKAGELAGLAVERIINEPTAAALDYGLSNLEHCKNVLVYDFGGGTLDVTVLELFEGVIDVKASCGNNSLGGKDFDEIIMRRLADVARDERALMRLKKAAEECKIALSTNEQVEISLPFLTTGAHGKPVSIERTIIRAEFEEWVKEKVESTRIPMMTALSDAGLIPSELDIVLLVGGSTRIPCVKQLVTRSLSIVPQSLVDPDMTVARGAAIQAGIIEGILTGERELILTDVCPYTLGVAVMHEGVYEDKVVFDPIIPRNTTIPTEKANIYFTYQDYQTQVSIKSYQGESIDPDNNELLGDIMLTDIPPAKRGTEPIEVTFAYDMNGILQVKARVVSTRNEISAEINTAGVKPKPVLDLSKWESAAGARRHRPAIRKAEKEIAAGNDEMGELELLIRQIKEALLLENEEQAESHREKLMSMLEELE
jgi:molecular chaperone DnaK